MDQKTAIIFPGVGYHVDKPLLYYGKKLAAEYGYEIIEVPYKGFASGIRGSKDKMKEAFELAMAQTEEMLRHQTFDETDELLIISKSVGTVVAAAWQKKHDLKAKNIYFTPVEATFDFARKKSGIVFHGTNDPWVETKIVKKGCKKLSLPLYMKENANHSMETGDVIEDIKTMKRIMKHCREYLQ